MVWRRIGVVEWGRIAPQESLREIIELREKWSTAHSKVVLVPSHRLKY